MKNVINYYYNLFPQNIVKDNDNYYFFINDIRYFFYKYDGDNVNEVYDMHIFLLNQNIYVHPIILNKDGNILTFVDNKPYVLMITKYYKGKINFLDIIKFNTLIYDKDINWGELWSNKNDYLEYQISMLGQNYKLIRDSFSYYIGLGETAIELINSIPKEKVYMSICHKRINVNDTYFDLYNPFNLMVDYKVRDVCEYLKSKYFSGESIDNDLDYYFTYQRLTYYEYILFLARMIYPTYYFDIFEEVIGNNLSEDNLKPIIDKVDGYEIVIKKIYQYFKVFLPILRIEWLDI